jgi:hypothetical protein
MLELAQAASGQQPPESVTLKISQDPTSYTLTVPVSRLVMTIPRGDLQLQRGAPGGASGSPRYFLFEDKSDPVLIISGWFESADGFKDIESFWRKETAAWKKQGLPKPRDVSFEHMGTWDAVLYDMPGGDMVNSNIRAHWVQSGSWIDIHISLTARGSATPLRPRLRDILQSITVAEKPQ